MSFLDEPRVVAGLERIDPVGLQAQARLLQILHTVSLLTPTSSAIVRVDQCVAMPHSTTQVDTYLRATPQGLTSCGGAGWPDRCQARR